MNVAWRKGQPATPVCTATDLKNKEKANGTQTERHSGSNQVRGVVLKPKYSDQLCMFSHAKAGVICQENELLPYPFFFVEM